MKVKKAAKFFIIFLLLMTPIIIVVFQYTQENKTVKTTSTITNQNKQKQEEKDKTESIDIDLLFDYDYQNMSLEEILVAYMNEHDLNGNNFSISYYNFTTKDSYYFNEDTLMFAASTYKLPLNMYYSQMIAEGKYSDNSMLYYDESCNEDSLGYVYNHYSYGDYVNLKTLQYQSIVASDNVSSCILFNALGGWAQMMEKISIYSDKYYIYTDFNQFCTGYMLDALKYLYENEAMFTNLITYLKDDASQTYLDLSLEDVEIANKYGNYYAVYNDVGIVYAKNPYAIAIYTDNAPKGSTHIFEINRIIYEFNIVNAS